MDNSNYSIQEMGRIAIFAAVTSVLAFITIPLPFSPVPVTGQTLGVMLAGVFLSGRNAFMSQVVYVLLGIAGLPVFSGGRSGIGILMGPTGGYIWGFILGAFVIGYFFNKNLSLINKIGILIAGGVAVIYVCGLFQFIIVTDRSIIDAISLTMLPYLPGDVLKILITLFVSNKIDLDRVLNK